MPILKKLASMLLIGAVGLMAGALTGGLATFYVYFIGAYVGAPVGMLLGGWLGLRTPLRDSVTLFVACYGGWALGAALAGRLGAGMPPDNLYYGLLDLSLPALGALAGVALLFLPVRRYVPFTRRRTVAAVLAAVAALWVLWRLYQYAYVWEPS